MTAQILSLMAVGALSGCQVYSDSWAAAEKACTPNGGVRFVISIAGNAEVLCQNGAKFTRLDESRMPK